MNLELNKKNIIMVSILIGLFIILIIVIRLSTGVSNKDNSVKNGITIVKNYNDFYTVNSCVYRYLTYLKNRDVDTVLKLLDDDFIKSNNINSNNLFSFLTSYEGNISFNSRKMYEEKVNSNTIKYYVYGYVEKDIIDSEPEISEAYFLVKLDKENKVFTISPYSGEIFK